MNEHETSIQQPPLKFDPETFLSGEEGKKFLRLTGNPKPVIRPEDRDATLHRIAKNAINYRKAQSELDSLNQLLNQTNEANLKKIWGILFGTKRIRSSNIYSIEQIDRLEDIKNRSEDIRRKIETNMQDILKDIADALRAIGIYNDDEAKPRNPDEEQLTNNLDFNPAYIKRVIDVFSEYFLNQESKK